MKFKRFISAALAALFVINAAVFAAEDTQEETIKFIVELKESPVIDEIQNGELKVFGLDDAAEKKAEKLLRTQSMVQNEIEEDIDENVIKGFNYTHVLNGFSMEGTAEDMAKIAVLPDVKAVCPVQTYEAPPKVENADITNCCSEMNIEYLRNNGISGQGQVIAVIDSGFDVQHEMFSGDIEDAVLSKNDIANIIADTELSCEKGKNITANRVYVSEKIPFAFNYTNKSADVYTGDDHGTHVAGITAGNNGKDVDGTRLTGAAPDAQLLLMSVQPENEHHMDSEAILAAFDDVAKLGANVVNCSFGAPFNTEGKLESKAVERLRKAGIGVFFSAGNIGRGICEDSDEIENYYYGISAENIDYGSIGTPSHPSATTVASSEAEMYRKTYKLMYVDGNEIAFSDANKNYLFADRFCDAEYEFVYCGLGTAEDTENIDANGKIALIDRGAYFTETVPNLTEKGAVGVIVI
ncbi:MAG: S8 family serine peptidase, partial [Firmicutes bacterium]|nr:S8 family serine peptidase [Bacillota bacterium]